MPWKVFKEGQKFCVYKRGEDGAKVGSSKGCHATRSEAMAQLRALYANVDEASKELTGFKAFQHGSDKYVWLWTSTAFQDREREIISTKALEDYVNRKDSTGNYGRLWYWHEKGIDFGTVVWSDVVGHILLELVRVDADEFGSKMFNALSQPEQFKHVLPFGWGTSHGYTYRKSDRSLDGVYAYIDKFESTVLPAENASNQFAGVKGVSDMAMTQKKKSVLEGIVGAELAASKLEEAQKASDDLEALGTAFKEFKPKDAAKKPMEVEAEADEEECDPETDENCPPAEKDEKGTDDQVLEVELDEVAIKSIADAVDVVSAVKSVMSSDEFALSLANMVQVAVTQAMSKVDFVGTKEEAVKDALMGRMSVRPYRASASSDNVIPHGDVDKLVGAKSARSKDDLVSGLVQGMLTGKL